MRPAPPVLWAPDDARLERATLTRYARRLAEHGIAAPSTTVVDAHAGYASRLYRAPPPERRPADWWWRGLWVEAQAGLPRAAVIFPIEGDRWMVTATGFARTYPPTDEEGYLAYLASLSTPAVAL